MINQILESKDKTWHHITGVTNKDLDAIKADFKYHHLDYEDISAETSISKMDTYKHYIFFVFHIPHVHKKIGHVYGEQLYVFLSKDSLVTITHSKNSQIEDLYYRLQKSSKQRISTLGKGTAFLMYRILFDSFRDSLKIVSDLTNEVSKLEQAIQHRHEKSITVQLGHARRNTLFLRHIIDPQRNILTSFSNIKKQFISDDLYVYFDDLHDSLDTIWLTADNLKLIIDGLFDVNEALLSHKTNEIVTLLTIISAAFMVPTFIAGFYGMNVSWLPFAENPQTIAFLYFAGFLGVIGVVLAIIKRPKT